MSLTSKEGSAMKSVWSRYIKSITVALTLLLSSGLSYSYAQDKDLPQVLRENPLAARQMTEIRDDLLLQVRNAKLGAEYWKDKSDSLGTVISITRESGSGASFELGIIAGVGLVLVTSLAMKWAHSE